MRATARWLIPLCGLLAYYTALANPYEFDDAFVVRDNLLLHQRGGLQQIWTSVGLTAGHTLEVHYRPLAMSSLWLGRRVHGDSAIGHRCVNLALHVACALLVFAFAERLLRRLWPRDPPARASTTALVASLLFVLHPINSPVVTQITKRTSSLCTALLLGALLCLDAALRAPASAAVDASGLARGGAERPRTGLLVTAFALAGLALLAKESAAVMPALALLYAARTGILAPASRRGAALLAGFCVLPAVYVATFFPSGALATGDHAALRHLFAQPRAMLDYAAMLVLPDRVPIAMGVAPAAWPPALPDVAGVVVLACLLAAAVAGFRRFPLASFALLWAAVCLAPTSSFAPMSLVGDPVRMYEAGIGLFIAAAAAFVGLGEAIGARAPAAIGRARGLLAALPVVLASLYLWFGTLALGADRAQENQAWAHAARLYPRDSVIASNWCGTEPDDVLAERVCRRALELDPDNLRNVMPRLAPVLARLGRFEQAEELLALGKARLGDQLRVSLAEARFAWVKGDLPRAHDAFRDVLLHDASHLEARLYLADVRLRLGLPDARPLVEDIAGVAGNDALQAMLASVRERLH